MKDTKKGQRFSPIHGLYMRQVLPSWILAALIIGPLSRILSLTHSVTYIRHCMHSFVIALMVSVSKLNQLGMRQTDKTGNRERRKKGRHFFLIIVIRSWVLPGNSLETTMEETKKTIIRETKNKYPTHGIPFHSANCSTNKHSI